MGQSIYFISQCDGACAIIVENKRRPCAHCIAYKHMLKPLLHKHFSKHHSETFAAQAFQQLHFTYQLIKKKNFFCRILCPCGFERFPYMFQHS